MELEQYIALPAGLKALPDAELVPVLQSLCVRDIDVEAVAELFDTLNLAEHDPLENKLVGTLVDIAKDPNTVEPVREGLRDLFVHLNRRGSKQVHTASDHAIAVRVAGLIAALQAYGIPASVKDEFYALAGGLAYADVTAEQVAELKAQAAAEATAEAAKQALRDWWAAKSDVVLEAIEAGTTKAGVVDSIKAP